MIPVTVTFYGDVGFDRSYNHVIDFSDETERENYFSPKTLRTIQNCAYNKPMNSIQVKCPYEEALNFTYCKFIIGSNPNSQKKIYAWVDDVILITDQIDETNTFIPILQINISVDPWQTFLFNFTLGESFVAREHVDRFKINADGTRGWTLSNTSDVTNVGLQKRKTKLVNLINKHNYYLYASSGTIGSAINDELYFICIQASKQNSSEIRVIFLPVAKDQYCIGNSTKYGRTLPIVNIYNGTYLDVLDIGSDFVSSVTFIPYDIFNYNGIITVGNYNIANVSLIFNDFEIKTTTGSDASDMDWVYFELKINSPDMLDIPVIYSKDITLNSTGLVVPVDDTYSIDHEPQLFKQPYRYVSIVDNAGAERGALPDIMANIPNQSFTLRFYLLIDSVDVKLRIVPLLPNNIETDSKYWIEYALPFVDVVSTHWLNYMLQQRDADRAMIQSQINQGAISNAIGGVSTGASMSGQQALKGASKGAMAGAGAIGLGVGAINTVGSYLSDSFFCFEQQDIREKAIKHKANTVISSGTFKSMVSDALNIYLMECDASTINIKAKEFHKYGYSVFFYETPNIKSRKYFNFIATNLVKIEGSLNNQVKMALAEIFNNGVTIWHGDYINELTGIGDYSKENIERSLL